VKVPEVAALWPSARSAIQPLLVVETLGRVDVPTATEINSVPIRDSAAAVVAIPLYPVSFQPYCRPNPVVDGGERRPIEVAIGTGVSVGAAVVVGVGAQSTRWNRALSTGYWRGWLVVV